MKREGGGASASKITKWWIGRQLGTHGDTKGDTWGHKRGHMGTQEGTQREQLCFVSFSNSESCCVQCIKKFTVEMTPRFRFRFQISCKRNKEDHS